MTKWHRFASLTLVASSPRVAIDSPLRLVASRSMVLAEEHMRVIKLAHRFRRRLERIVTMKEKTVLSNQGEKVVMPLDPSDEYKLQQSFCNWASAVHKHIALGLELDKYAKGEDTSKDDAAIEEEMRAIFRELASQMSPNEWKDIVTAREVRGAGSKHTH